MPRLMSSAQVASYADWLKKLAGRSKGALADYLRAAAARITEGDWQ